MKFKINIPKSINGEAIEKFREEFINVLMDKDADKYLFENKETLARFIPEFKKSFNFNQNNPYHIYDVFEHTTVALSYARDNLIIRLAVLFHDIGKPASYTEGEDGRGHFKGHGRVSAKITKEVLKRLKFDNEIVDKVVQLIFYHDATFVVGKKYVRRWLNKIGKEQFERLLDVHEADIYGHNPVYIDEGISTVAKLRELLIDVDMELEGAKA